MIEAAIINLISEAGKLKIKEQIQHLEKVSEDDEYRERFSNMLDGAKTIIWILENESIGKHGTENYLKHLDRDQLKFAIDAATKILAEKTSLGKIKLYGVFGGKCGAKWFYNKDDAKKEYMIAAKESLDEKYPEVSLDSSMVPIEELEEYLGVDKANELKKSIDATKV